MRGLRPAACQNEPDLIAAGPGAEAERRRESGSDDVEQQARDTPQQQAAAQVWDASGLGASARLMADQGLLDICAALLMHSKAAGDGALQLKRSVQAATGCRWIRASIARHRHVQATKPSELCPAPRRLDQTGETGLHLCTRSELESGSTP